MRWGLVLSGTVAAAFFALGFELGPPGDAAETLCLLGGVASGMLFIGLADGA